MIVAEVIAKATTEVSFVKQDHVVEEFAPDGSDHALSERVLPRGVRRDEDLARPMAFTRCRNCPPKMPSRSRMRNRGAESWGKASTTCCAVQAAVAESVTLKCTTRRR